MNEIITNFARNFDYLFLTDFASPSPPIELSNKETNEFFHRENGLLEISFLFSIGAKWLLVPQSIAKVEGTAFLPVDETVL